MCVRVCVRADGRSLNIYIVKVVIERGVDSAVQEFLRNPCDEFLGYWRREEHSLVDGERGIDFMVGRGRNFNLVVFGFSIKHEIKLKDAEAGRDTYVGSGKRRQQEAVVLGPGKARLLGHAAQSPAVGQVRFEVTCVE